MNSPSPDTGLVDDFFLMSAEFEDRFVLLSTEERNKVERYLRVLIRDIGLYALANSQGWLSDLLLTKPALIVLGDILAERRPSTVRAEFKDFSIRFIIRRRPGRVVAIALIRNCNS